VWKIVHNNVEPFLRRVSPSYALESRKQVGHAFSLMDSARQAIAVNVVEPEKLFGASQASVGRSKPLWMPNGGPMLAVDGFKFEWSPFIEAQNHAIVGSFMIEFKNAVFFSRSPGLGTSSRSWFAAGKDLLGEEAFVSIHY